MKKLSKEDETFALLCDIRAKLLSLAHEVYEFNNKYPEDSIGECHILEKLILLAGKAEAELHARFPNFHF